MVSFSRPHILSHSTSTVSPRKSLRETISAHFTSIDVYPLSHSASCSQAFDSVMVSPRTLFLIVGIPILLGMARRMSLKKGVELGRGE